MEVSKTKIDIEVPADVWQKFERMTGDVGKDRAVVLTDLINKAYAEILAEELAAQQPIVAVEETPTATEATA